MRWGHGWVYVPRHRKPIKRTATAAADGCVRRTYRHPTNGGTFSVPHPPGVTAKLIRDGLTVLVTSDLLIIQGIHNTRDRARRALTKRAEKVARRLILRHLRKRPLQVVKQLFRVVGIKFTRKAFLEKGIPLVAIPLSAGVNEASTRLLANQAIKFYDTEVS